MSEVSFKELDCQLCKDGLGGYLNKLGPDQIVPPMLDVYAFVFQP